MLRDCAGILGRVFSAASIFFLIGAPVAIRGQARANGESRAFTPFISHEKELRFSKGDDGIPEEVDSTQARRSDGSTADSWIAVTPYATGTETEHGTLIFDSVRRVSITLEPSTKSVITTHLSPTQVSKRLTEERACEDIDSDTIVIRDSESILGYATIEEIDNLSDEKSETWVATGLDCYPLKETTQFLDELGGHNEYTVLDIREGNPPAGMFSVPIDYVERSPQQVEAVYEAMFPGRVLYAPPILKKLGESYEGSTNLK